MIETPVLFGRDSTLVGIVTKPANNTRSDIACLTFNAGVVPRIGPHRFNVKLARYLVQSGILSMRFDISGLGDSRPSAAGRGFLQQAIVDIQAAMDSLEAQYGIRKFVLIGNCSGAVQVYWTAQADSRVAGLLMFDGYTYHTRWSRPVRHWKRFRSLGWGNAVRAVTRRLATLVRLPSKVGASASQEAPVVEDDGTTPSRADYCQHIQSLVDRNTKILWVYSGGIIDYYSYANQYRDAFGREPFFGKVQYQFVPEIDHTLLSLDSQHRLIGIAGRWLETVFPLP